MTLVDGQRLKVEVKRSETTGDAQGHGSEAELVEKARSAIRSATAQVKAFQGYSKYEINEINNMSKSEVPKADPFKTRKRSGTARAKCPKTDQKRGPPRTENGTSESGKKKP